MTMILICRHGTLCVNEDFFVFDVLFQVKHHLFYLIFIVAV